MLSNSSVLYDILPQLLLVVLIIPSIVLHEMGHGFAAYKLGDPTAKSQGRLSPNPLKHLDLVGSIILPLILALGGGPVIGFAKPVPYNPRYFKNIRVGELVVGLAGPFVNLLLALLGALVCFIASRLFGTSPDVAIVVFSIAYYFTYINLVLMFFNLIPLPPLDGSSIIALFLTDNGLQTYYKVQRYALIILIVVLVIVPTMTGIDPVGIYLRATAGNLINVLVPW